MADTPFLISKGYKCEGGQWMTPSIPPFQRIYTRNKASDFLRDGHEFFPRGGKAAQGWRRVTQ